jgi:hypothetical protein
VPEAAAPDAQAEVTAQAEPAAVGGKLTRLEVPELQARYLDMDGRPTGSVNAFSSPVARIRLRRATGRASVDVTIVRRFSPRVLLGAVLLAMLIGTVNNALNPNRVPWMGRPALLQNLDDPEPAPHLKGLLSGVRYAWRELGEQATTIAIGAATILAVSLVLRLSLKCRWGVLAESWFRVGVAAMCVAAAWYKVKNPTEFAMAVAQYRLLPAPVVRGFSLWLPSMEMVVSAGLLFSRWSREFYLLLVGLWLMFIVALAQALLRRLGIACGCFDIPGATSTGETWFSLLRDVVLLVPIAYLAFKAENRFLWRPAASP